MNYQRRTDPHREASPREKLERIARTFRPSTDINLEALIEDLSPRELRDRGRCAPVDKILEDAFQVHFVAFEALRRSGEGRPSAVRGCTLDLMLLIIQHALTLDALWTTFSRKRAQRVAAAGVVEQRLRERFARAMTLREQARRLLAAVVRDDPEGRAAVARASIAKDAEGSVAAAMTELAVVGATLLASCSPATAQRAKLLGLDREYVFSLGTLGGDLMADEAELKKLAEVDDGEDEVLLEAGRAVYLLLMVYEAFEAGHEVDATVPRLRLVHTRHLVRRLSKLPPAPMPVPRKLNLPVQDRSGPGAEFNGGLGRRR